MQLSTSLGVWTTTFLTSLGLAPLTACSGTDVERNQNASEAGTGGGDGAGGGASAGGAGGTGGVPIAPSCDNPTPQLGADGRPTGFVLCGGGSFHRPEKKDCTSILPRPGECSFNPGSDAGAWPGSCRSDADCTDRPNGYCMPPIQAPACGCSYGCLRDEDCGAGQICLCGDPVGQCVAAACRTDADCPSVAPDGPQCLSYVANPGCGGTAFACRTAADTCTSDADCGTNESCALVLGRHQCQARTCAIGRPFLVLGETRLAETARRSDWASPLAPCTDGLDGEARAALAARWTEIALMEHASIAAFARFALELLSLGAPPELVVATHRAMADETVHARDAFALASAYLGRAVGPGRLDVDAALASRSPLDVVRTAVLEGCIGETIAAVEAAEALAHATDGAVCEALARVTEDETRHAELAWRFVQWMLSHGDEELRQATAGELLRLVEAEARAPRDGHGQRTARSRVLLAHGVIDEATRGEIRRRVLGEIILPCARSLVAESTRTVRRTPHAAPTVRPLAPRTA